MTTTRLALYAALGALCVYATPTTAGAQVTSAASAQVTPAVANGAEQVSRAWVFRRRFIRGQRRSLSERRRGGSWPGIRRDTRLWLHAETRSLRAAEWSERRLHLWELRPRAYRSGTACALSSAGQDCRPVRSARDLLTSADTESASTRLKPVAPVSLLGEESMRTSTRRWRLARELPGRRGT